MLGGKKPRAARLLGRRGRGRLHTVNAEQGPGEQPWQVVHTAGDAHLVADRPHDVIGRQHREDVEPAPEEGCDLLGPDIDDPAQQPVEDAAPARRGAGRWACLAHPSWSTPTTRWHSRTSSRGTRSSSGGWSCESTSASLSQRTNCFIITAWPALNTRRAPPRVDGLNGLTD